jgi:integrase
MKIANVLKSFEETLKVRQKADATIEQYTAFASRYLEFCNGKGFPTAEVAICEFLSSLTPCSVANQKGALSALAGKNGFYNSLGREIGKLPEWVFASRPVRIPVWTTVTEAEAIITKLEKIDEVWATMAKLMFGSGLRIGETCNLRWRAFDFERGTVSIWSGKGDKCRIVALSEIAIEALLIRRERCRELWERDRENKRPGVAPVPELLKKFPSHGLDWPFFFVFPSAKESRDPETGIVRRHHVHEKSFSRPMRDARRRSKIDKRVTAHSFRHGFATLYLLMGGNLRELQERMGHDSIDTTMGYLHCLPNQFDRIGSPWDVAKKSRAQLPPENIVHPRFRTA